MKKICEEKYIMYGEERELGWKFVVKECISKIGNPIFSMVMNHYHPHIQKRKYCVSVCAIFRDESIYLKEWIEYHLVIGVEHFYLYNNFSIDNYRESLDAYIDKGLVTLIDWPFKLAQMEAYADCVDKYSDETNWIGFIDLDEFIVPNKFDTISKSLKKFRNRPLVIVNWRFFGTSGMIERDLNTLVTERFTIGWPKYYYAGKLFFNTAYEWLPGMKCDMHYRWAGYKGIKFPPVNIENKPCLFKEINHLSTDRADIQINHYVVKSYCEYQMRKKNKSGGVHGVGVHNDKYFIFHEHNCTKEETNIFKYLLELKKRMDCV